MEPCYPPQGCVVEINWCSFWELTLDQPLALNHRKLLDPSRVFDYAGIPSPKHSHTHEFLGPPPCEQCNRHPYRAEANRARQSFSDVSTFLPNGTLHTWYVTKIIQKHLTGDNYPIWLVLTSVIIRRIVSYNIHTLYHFDSRLHSATILVWYWAKSQNKLHSNVKPKIHARRRLRCCIERRNTIPVFLLYAWACATS